MAYNIEYLPEAYEDLDAIFEYLSRFYRSTASTFFRTLKHRISQLADNPHMAEAWEDEPDFRKLLVDDYLVFYMVYNERQTVEIHRILRASWNIKPR